MNGKFLTGNQSSSSLLVATPLEIIFIRWKENEFRYSVCIDLYNTFQWIGTQATITKPKKKQRNGIN